jgi:AAA family ATP:ADP antiporter
VLCTAIAATFVYLQQAKLTHDALADHDTRTEFFASIDLGASLVAFGLQTLVTPRLLQRFGPGVVLLGLPIAQAAGISILAIAPSLGALAIVQIVSRATTHGFTRPARELLFTAIDRDSKYRAKNVIDTVVYRFGDLASSWLYTGLAAIGAGSTSLVVAAVPLVGIWLVFAATLGLGFRRRTKESA